MLQKVSYLLLIVLSPSFCFSQTTASADQKLSTPAYKEYLKNSPDLSRSEKRALRRMDRAERKAARIEERKIRRSSKKCPYNTTRCTFDWRDY